MCERPLGGPGLEPDGLRRAVRAGRAYRRLIRSLGAICPLILIRIVLWGMGFGGIPDRRLEAALGIAYWLVTLAQLVAEVTVVVSTWRLAKSLKRRPLPWLLVMLVPLLDIVGFLPLVDLVGALLLNRMLKAVLMPTGVGTGLLGPSARDLDALEASAPGDP